MNHLEIKKLLESTEISDQTYFKIDSLDLRYCINRKGVLWDHLLSKPIYPYLSNKQLKYNLYLNNSRTTILMDRLYLMAFQPMDTTFEIYKNILNIVKYDNTCLLPEIQNLNWLIPFGGIESKTYKNYFSIVGNDNLVVSKDYVFLNFKTGKPYTITYPEAKDRYPMVSRSKGDINLYPLSTTTVHRLIALAFLPIPNFKEALLINHKDGDKRNFKIENLEWVTYRENNVHAFKSGLRNDNIAIIAIDIYTEKKRYFHSLQEAARELGMHAWDISVAKKTYKESGFIKYPPWLFLDIDDKIPSSFKNIQKSILSYGYLYFKIVNKETNKVEYIRGIKNLSKYTKTKYVIDLVKENNVFEINNYIITKVRKNELPMDIKETLLNEHKSAYSKHGGKEQIPIRVTDLSNNAVITYNSTDEFATLVGAKRKTIQHGVHLNKGFWRNFKIEYLR